MANLTVSKSDPWAKRHNKAVACGISQLDPHRQPFPNALVQMLLGWEAYAAAHLARYEAKIGDDGVLGAEWQRIGEGLLGLLNGETGDLDCGTLDRFLRETMREHGVELEA